MVRLLTTASSGSAHESIAAFNQSTALLSIHVAAGSLRSGREPFVTRACTRFALGVVHAVAFRIARFLGLTNTLGIRDLNLFVNIFPIVTVSVRIISIDLVYKSCPFLRHSEFFVSQSFRIAGTSAIDAREVDPLDFALVIPTAIGAIKFLGLAIPARVLVEVSVGRAGAGPVGQDSIIDALSLTLERSPCQSQALSLARRLDKIQ
jgi:hypothetical protein